MLYTIGKLLAPGSQKSSHFLRSIEWRYAMDHSKIGTLRVVQAETSEQMKIKTNEHFLEKNGFFPGETF